MMTRKDYQRAAEITNRYYKASENPLLSRKDRADAIVIAMGIEGAFTELFRSEPNFDETRFHNACGKDDQ